MWKSNVCNIAKRGSRASRSEWSRIITFGKDDDSLPDDLDDSTPDTGNVGTVTTSDSEATDFDSCLSPVDEPAPAVNTSSGNRRISIELPAPTKRNSVASTGGLDFDSCMSPISTPKWTVQHLEELRANSHHLSFIELHKLLVDGSITHFSARPNSHGGKALAVCPKVPPRTVIVPGSFNPLHYGHVQLAKRAVSEVQNASGEYYFEMSTVNVDKGVTPADEMERRVDLITAKGHPCILSNAILFDAKSVIFPNCIFAIGFDTYVRVINPKYYPRVTGGIDATMARVEANGCEFFVGGRLSGGVYRELAPSPEELTDFGVDLDDSQVADEFELVENAPADEFRGRNVCIRKVGETGPMTCNEEPMSPIFSPMPRFRHDISSTEIREGRLDPSV